MICQLEQDVDNSNLIDPNEISSNLHMGEHKRCVKKKSEIKGVDLEEEEEEPEGNKEGNDDVKF